MKEINRFYYILYGLPVGIAVLIGRLAIGQRIKEFLVQRLEPWATRIPLLPVWKSGPLIVSLILYCLLIYNAGIPSSAITVVILFFLSSLLISFSLIWYDAVIEIQKG